MKRNAKPIIGLSGAIGSGKSSLAAALGKLGCLVISSDQLNHEALARREVQSKLRDWWGGRVFSGNGEIDRSAIAAIIFENRDEKQRLESLVYPLIAAQREDMIQGGLRDQAVSAIALDSPLLFESHLDRLCDVVIFIEIDEAERRRRLVKNRGWDEAELHRREQWQLSPAEKRSRANFVIVNDGALVDLQEQARLVLGRILAQHAHS